jgi:hypothetical protein
VERPTFTPDTNWITNYNVYVVQLTQGAYVCVSKQKGVQPADWPTGTIIKASNLAAAKPFFMRIRKAGRPFDLPAGRART